jgi:ABC-type phosphate/phosphonate transport system ATPase subunit
MLRFGYLVFVIGRSGTGKSVLLNYVTPGKVIDKLNELIRQNHVVERSTIGTGDIPKGLFSIDEPQNIESESFKATIECLAVEHRHFMIASQQERVLNELFNNVRLWKSWRRVFVVYLVMERTNI